MSSLAGVEAAYASGGLRGLSDLSSRIAEIEKTPTPTRHRLATLLTQYQAVSNLEGELQAQRMALTELQQQVVGARPASKSVT